MAQGDHLYVNRLGGAYSHHGIDCGDGTVIHYTNTSLFSSRIIERTDLATFAQDDEVLVRDYTDFFSTVQNPALLDIAEQQLSRWFNQLKGLDMSTLDFTPEAVVARAESRLGETTFHLLFHNCEHFSTWCKTGIHSSKQVNAIWKQTMTPTKFYRYRANSFLTAMIDPLGLAKRPSRVSSE